MDRVQDLSERAHFTSGYLDRHTKARIATLVSGLNQSSYCTNSHGEELRDLGTGRTEIAALSRADLDAVPVSSKERALLEFVRHLTLKPGEVTAAEVDHLHAAGWGDEQIFEASFDAALFAFFNRVAATYGLELPADGWQKGR